MAECTHGGDIHMDRHKHGGVNYIQGGVYIQWILHTVECAYGRVYTHSRYTHGERDIHTEGDTDTKGTYTRRGRTHGHTHGGDVHTDETSTQRGYTHGGDVRP